MAKASRIFVPYRTLGLVSNSVPLTIRYIQRRRENLAITVVGKSFHTYGCSKLDLLSVSKPHDEDIECMTADAYLVYTSCKNVIYAWRRGTELQHTYRGHSSNVHLMLPFGPHLISVDEDSHLKVWDIKSEELFLELEFNTSFFDISAIMHPSTYLNKILLGSTQGSMQLWNLATSKLIYTFNGWNQPITVLEQAPAINVVGIGLSSGDILIHNLMYDKTILKFSQEWGPVTSISFRTDGPPIMATGSNIGHIALWDLEKKHLVSQIRDAHRSNVCGMKFLPDEPLLITSSPDNSLKIWIFDNIDGSGRLLHIRQGHCSPPTKIRFYGTNGHNILSSGLDSTLRSFSTLVDNLNKNLGQASYNRKKAKKLGVLKDRGKMSPITDFAFETTREKEWDNIVACHRGLDIVTTWSYDRCCMGSHKLLHKRFKGEHNVVALCAALTSCGNYVLIGYNTGHVDKYNIQSGFFRGTYGKERAHEGSVRGLGTGLQDQSNRIVVTGGSDKTVKFWNFKECKFLSFVSLESSVSYLIVHKESGLVAVSLDNFAVVIIDQETKHIVRTFREHGNRITDMTFSQDARWLLTSSMDAAIRVWDLPTGSLIDYFLVSSICTSFSMSLTGEYLATVHSDELGIYLWSNNTLYSHVTLQPLPSDYVPKLLNIPDLASEDLIEALESEEIYKSPEQISNNLVSLSSLPNSRWQNLLNLDIIKNRNKPIEPPKVPKHAPFFLPTIPGLEPKFAIEEKEEETVNKSKILNYQEISEFSNFILQCDKRADFEPVLCKLKEMTVSSIDREVRLLSSNSMLCFLKALNQGLCSNKDFELIHSYLGLFLKVHGSVVASNSELKEYCKVLKDTQSKSWEQLQMKLNLTLCLVKQFKNAVL